MVFKTAKYNHSTLAVFFICIHIALGQTSTDRVWRTDCFMETDSGQCEKSWIKISSSYYTCDKVIELEAPPKRIRYSNGNILAAIGSRTFVVLNGTLVPMTARRFISPWDEFVDKKDNRYYAAEGTTYMAESETKKEIEILTTGEYSVNQLTFDNETNLLLILSFSTQTDMNKKIGSLFAINTATIDVANDRVQAEKVDGAGDFITAMAVEGDLGKLLLGIQTSQGGKLIRLTKQKVNPCSENTAKKDAILEVIKDAQEKLLRIFEDVSITPSHANLLSRSMSDESSRFIEMENIRLKRDLHVATAKLKSFTEKLFNFNHHLKSVKVRKSYEPSTPEYISNSPIHYLSLPDPGGPPDSSGMLDQSPLSNHSNEYVSPPGYGAPENTKNMPKTMILQAGKEQYIEIERAETLPNCVPIEMFNFEAQKARDTEKSNQELKIQLAELTLTVEGILMEANQEPDLTPTYRKIERQP